MTIVRREHRAHFTIVPNALFTDTRLSVEAKGVLGYLLSRPHLWRVRLDYVGRTLKVGRKKLQRIFRELIGAGYVTREPQRFVAGHAWEDDERDRQPALRHSEEAIDAINGGRAVDGSTAHPSRRLGRAR